MRVQLEFSGKVKLPIRVIVNGESYEIKEQPFICSILESAENTYGFDALHSWLGERLKTEQRERLYQFIQVNRYVKIKDIAYVLDIHRQLAKEIIQAMTDENALERYATIWVRTQTFIGFLGDRYQQQKVEYVESTPAIKEDNWKETLKHAPNMERVQRRSRSKGRKR